MKKDHMVGTRLPTDVVRDLEVIERAEQSDRSTVLRRLLQSAIREWKLANYAKRYGQGAITLARAAELAGVTLWEMMDYVRRHKIPAQYDVEDLLADVATIRARGRSR